MRALATILLGLMLGACAGDGAARYVAPPGVSHDRLADDLAACRADGEMIRDRAERAIMVDDCMGDRGYNLAPHAP